MKFIELDAPGHWSRRRAARLALRHPVHVWRAWRFLRRWRKLRAP